MFSYYHIQLHWLYCDRCVCVVCMCGSVMVKQLSQFELTQSANSFVYCSEFILLFLQQFYFILFFIFSSFDDKDNVARCAFRVVHIRFWMIAPEENIKFFEKHLDENVSCGTWICNNYYTKRPNSGCSNSINSNLTSESQTSVCKRFLKIFHLFDCIDQIIVVDRRCDSVEKSYRNSVCTTNSNIFNRHTHTHT